MNKEEIELALKDPGELSNSELDEIMNAQYSILKKIQKPTNSIPDMLSGSNGGPKKMKGLRNLNNRI